LCRQGKHVEGLALLDDRGMCAQAAEESDDPDNDEPDRFELGGEITEPVKISGDYPKYPEADRLARIEGTVVLDSLIGPDGALQCVRVMDGPSPNMNCSAALAVMNWRFEPARLDGEPVEVFYILSVRFQLR
jgi:TonB family protein